VSAGTYRGLKFTDSLLLFFQLSATRERESELVLRDGKYQIAAHALSI
jgi:hypothetical protein